MSLRAVAVSLALGSTVVFWCACGPADPESEGAAESALARALREVSVGVEDFRAANEALDAEGVVERLWPEFSMLVDGRRIGYEEVAAGSRDFMVGLQSLDAEWTDLVVTPYTPDLAVASFLFRDSVVTTDGAVLLSRGPTTLIWERREGEWRMIFGDADHYPVEPRP